MPSIPLHIQFNSLADAEMRHRHQRVQPMTHVHAKGSIEARLDRLEARAQVAITNSDLKSVMRGILDLLRDVLLEEQPK